MTAMLRCAAVIAALFFCLVPAALAQDVTLRAHGGQLAISGELLSYDGQVYRVRTVHGVLAVDALAVACAGPGCPQLALIPPRFRVLAEDTAMAALMAGLIRDFAATQRRQITEEDGALALSDADGVVLARFAIGIAPGAEARRLMARGGAELALIDAAPWPPEGRLVGHDAVVAVVATQNPVRHIALTDLARVLAGEIVDWQALGGPPAPVVVHALAVGVGARRLAEARIGPHSGAAILHDNPAALADAVARDPWAIALLPARVAHSGLQRLRLTDRCGALLASDGFDLRAGDYPLSMALQLVPAGGRLHPVVRGLRDHLATPSAQALVAAAGLADLTQASRPATAQGARLVNAIRAAEGEGGLAALKTLGAALAAADRLSATFRFEPGTARLDPASRLMATDLAARIAAGTLDREGLVLAGFGTDARDGRALAEAVAAAVAGDGAEAAQVATAAFGAISPLGCADTAAGLHLNRRVELWRQVDQR